MQKPDKQICDPPLIMGYTHYFTPIGFSVDEWARLHKALTQVLHEHVRDGRIKDLELSHDERTSRRRLDAGAAARSRERPVRTRAG